MASPSFTQYHALQHHHEGVELQPPSLSDADPISPIFPGDVDLPWRPFYLRRRILCAFAAIFSLIIAAAETLLAVSDKNNGISSASAPVAQHYLWVYGPIAVLTLIAAIWSRVEYQSKLVAPWIRLSKQPSDAKRTLLLDYISDFQLFVVFKALHNRDYTVSIICAVSLIIRAMVVISSGLTTLAWTHVHRQSWPMVVQDRFIDSNSRLTNPGNFIPDFIRGLQKYNLTYPDGVSDTYAFQSVQADLPDGAESRVTVDGFENFLECKMTELTVENFIIGDNRPLGINMTIASSDCNTENLVVDGPRVAFGFSAPKYSQLFARFVQVQCDRQAGNPGKRSLVVLGNITYSPDPSNDYGHSSGNIMRGYQARLEQSTQLLCVPAYEITKVDVVRNGTLGLSVTASPGATVRNLHSVTAWNMMESQFSAYGSYSYPEPIWVGGDRRARIDENFDGPMSLAISSHIAAIGPVNSLLDAELLERLVTSYYRQFTAILAKHLIMGPTNVGTMGSIVTYENRLVVQHWAAQLTACLAAACVVALTILAIFFVPRRGILPCDPTNLPQVAFLVAWSRILLERLRFSGAADTKNLGQALQNYTFQSRAVPDGVSKPSHFAVLNIGDSSDESRAFPQVDLVHRHPFVLHPASRLALCILLAALVVILQLTLRQSNSNDGIGDVANNIYIHYSWTVIPALFLGILAMVVSTVDFHMRSLAPYIALKRPLTARAFLALDFMNMSTPRAILRQIRGAHPGALAGTLAFLVASLLPIASTSLFLPRTIPITISAVLRTNASFWMHPGVSKEASLLASLVFEGNLSFPRLTYSDLAFPQLLFTPPFPVEDNPVNISTLSVVVDVPALRSRLICRTYDTLTIQTNVRPDIADGNDSVVINIRGDHSDDFIYNAKFFSLSNMTYFGIVDPEGSSYSDILYIWGSLKHFKNPTIHHIAAMACNESFETVSVSTTFIGTTLNIDPHHPPKPLEHTAHPSTITISPILDLLYNYLASTNAGPEHLTQFFTMLTSSRWAIPLSSLGDPAATSTVSAAIKHQHAIIQAQNLAQQLTPANTSTSTLPPDHLPITDASPLYHGNATTAPGEGRRRVVQDPTSTRVLQGLLGAVLLLVLASWAGVRETDVLPRAPTTIASAVALVAGGNLLGEEEREGFLRFLASSGKGGLGGIGDGGEDESLNGGSELEGKRGVSSWEGARFWMGWGTVPDLEGRWVGGGENEGGASRFGIYVVWDKEEEEEEEDHEEEVQEEDAAGVGMREKHVFSIGRWTLLRTVE